MKSRSYNVQSRLFPPSIYDFDNGKTCISNPYVPDQDLIAISAGLDEIFKGDIAAIHSPLTSFLQFEYGAELALSYSNVLVLTTLAASRSNEDYIIPEELIADQNYIDRLTENMAYQFAGQNNPEFIRDNLDRLSRQGLLIPVGGNETGIGAFRWPTKDELKSLTPLDKDNLHLAEKDLSVIRANGFSSIEPLLRYLEVSCANETGKIDYQQALEFFFQGNRRIGSQRARDITNAIMLYCETKRLS